MIFNNDIESIGIITDGRKNVFSSSNSNDTGEGFLSSKDNDYGDYRTDKGDGCGIYVVSVITVKEEER